MVKRLVTAAVVALLSACAENTASYQQARGGQFTKRPALYSTRSSILAEGKWRFLLMPSEYTARAAPNYSHLYTLGELTTAFRSLAPRPNLWSYPSESLQHRVKDAARNAGVVVHTDLVYVD